MRRSGFNRLGYVLFLSLVATHVAFAAASLQILKLDPSPVQVGAPLVIVYRLGNTGAAQATFQLQLLIDSPSAFQYQTVPAGGTVVLNWGTTVSTPGSKTVTLQVWEQVGSRNARPCPSCPLESLPIYGNPQSVTRALMVFTASNAPLQPQLLNIGPPGQEGSIPSDDSESGVMNQVVGDSSILYAVSTHAGVWRRTSPNNWVQLAHAPPRAACIAVDPGNNQHLIVGERGDDKPIPPATANDLIASRSGAWESQDGGDSWVKIYDPGLDPNYPSAALGAVRAVAFGPFGKLIFIATARGIGVRVASDNGSPITVFPVAAQGDVQELAVGPNIAWGLTSDHRLLVLNMPQANWQNPLAPLPWTSVKIPPTVTLSMAAPGDKRTVTNVLTNCGIGCENIRDKHPPGGLTGYNGLAVLVFTPFVSPSHPLATEDPNCKSPVTVQVCDIFQNRIGVLVFNSAQSSWSGQLTKDRDGRGLGGKAFAVTANLNCPALPDQLDERQRFYVSAGQGLQEALALEPDGRFLWDDPVGGSEFQSVPKQHWGGPFGGHATKLHVDFWDFHVDPNVCPPGHFTAWLANDGGIYQADVSTSSGIGTRPNPKFVGTLSGLDWQIHDVGLWTHNVNALVAVKQATASAAHLFYATGDNDGFWGVSAGSLPGLKPGQWRGGGTAGDAISAVADGSTMAAVGMRDYWAGGTCGSDHCAFLTKLQSGSVQGFNVGGRLTGLVSSTIFTFIQSTQPEVVSNSVKDLDAVILVNLPIQEPAPKNTTKPIPGIYGKNAGAARAVLLRHSSFQKDLDGTTSHFSKWIIARDNLPSGTERFWVGGGHGDPRYFFFAPGSTSCPGGLFGDLSNGQYPCLLTNLAIPSGGGAISGPVFVSPYLPQTFFLLQLGTTPSVQYTTNGGTSFCQAPNITKLVTGSGQFPISADGNGQFDPSGRFTDAGEAYHGSTLPIISQVAFDRSDPSAFLVITPLSGVYFGRLGDGRNPCTEPAWLALQRPDDNWAYPSSGVLLDGTAFIGTEGRGMFEISSPASGLAASYFDISPDLLLGTRVATLRSSNGAPIPWALYSLVLREQNGQFQTVLGQRTDGSGTLNVPGVTVNPAALACELSFFGDAQNAPTSIRFNCSTQ